MIMKRKHIAATTPAVKIMADATFITDAIIKDMEKIIHARITFLISYANIR